MVEWYVEIYEVVKGWRMRAPAHKIAAYIAWASAPLKSAGQSGRRIWRRAGVEKVRGRFGGGRMKRMIPKG